MKDKTQYEFKPCESVSKKPKHYIRITDNMMDSKAWEGLSCQAIVIYMNIKKKYNFTNENNLSFTYKEGLEIMNKRTFTKSIDNLIDNGFIYIVRQGLLKQCSIYGLSDNWQYFGTSAFKVVSRVKRMNKSKGQKCTFVGGKNTP